METKQEISEWNMQTLGFAMRELGSAFGHRRDNSMEIIHDVQSAQRYMTEFMGAVIPTPNLTPAGAELSQALHCAMRKWMDSPLSSLLYNMISESRGMRVWISFVHGLIDNKFRFERAMTMAEKAYRESNSGTDDMFMKCMLEMWMEQGGQEDVKQVASHLSLPVAEIKKV